LAFTLRTNTPREVDAIESGWNREKKLNNMFNGAGEEMSVVEVCGDRLCKLVFLKKCFFESRDEI